MVTLLVYPPISNTQQVHSALTPDELERIESLTEDLGNLLAPMARIAARDTLEDLLHSSAPRFLSIKNEMMGLLWPFMSFFIEGHLSGIRKMLEEDKYCVDVLKQTYAVRRAIEKMESILLEGHLQSCVVEGIKEGREDEVVDII